MDSNFLSINNQEKFELAKKLLTAAGIEFTEFPGVFCAVVWNDEDLKKSFRKAGWARPTEQDLADLRNDAEDLDDDMISVGWDILDRKAQEIVDAS